MSCVFTVYLDPFVPAQVAYKWGETTTTKHRIDVSTIGARSAKIDTYRPFLISAVRKHKKPAPLNDYRCWFFNTNRHLLKIEPWAESVNRASGTHRRNLSLPLCRSYIFLSLELSCSYPSSLLLSSSSSSFLSTSSCSLGATWRRPGGAARRQRQRAAVGGGVHRQEGGRGGLRWRRQWRPHPPLRQIWQEGWRWPDDSGRGWRWWWHQRQPRVDPAAAAASTPSRLPPVADPGRVFDHDYLKVVGPWTVPEGKHCTLSFPSSSTKPDAAVPSPWKHEHFTTTEGKNDVLKTVLRHVYFAASHLKALARPKASRPLTCWTTFMDKHPLLISPRAPRP